MVRGRRPAKPTERLVDLAPKFSTDKGTVHSYLDVYDGLFAPLRDQAIVLLEIGVERGGSLQLWRSYFSRASIHGLDIAHASVEGEDLHLHRFRQADRQRIEATWSDEFFDVVIDDGSHRIEDQLLSLCFLWPKLKPGGLYVVEDVQSKSYERYFAAFRPLCLDRSGIRGRHDDYLVILQKR